MDVLGIPATTAGVLGAEGSGGLLEHQSNVLHRGMRMETTITLMKTRKSLREMVLFGLSAVLFAILYLVPGLSGSYAEAQCGGGGGGGATGKCNEYERPDGITVHEFGSGACYQCGAAGCHTNYAGNYCHIEHNTCG